MDSSDHSRLLDYQVKNSLRNSPQRESLGIGGGTIIDLRVASLTFFIYKMFCFYREYLKEWMSLLSWNTKSNVHLCMCMCTSTIFALYTCMCVYILHTTCTIYVIREINLYDIFIGLFHRKIVLVVLLGCSLFIQTIKQLFSYFENHIEFDLPIPF